MAKLSGIILIIVAILDLLAGIIYLGGGAVTQVVTGIGTTTIEQRAATNGGLSDDQQLEIDRMLASGAWESGALFAFGLFLLVVTVVLIIAALRLFKRRSPGLVYAAAGLAVLAEAGGIYLLGFKLLNLPGLLGAVLAAVAAYRLKQT